MKEVLKLDLDELDLRSAITGTITLAPALVFVGILGDAGLAAGIAALFVVASGRSRTQGPDAASFVLVAVGAVITLLVGYSADSAVAASVTIAVVTLVATLAAFWGSRYSTAGVFAVMWAILVLTVGAEAGEAVAMALAFALGGAMALTAMWISSRIPSDDLDPGIEVAPVEEAAPSDADASAQDDAHGSSPTDATQQASVDARSPGPDTYRLVTFSIHRALIVGASLLIGYRWFPDHATWMALTFVLVVRPPAHQVIVTGVARTLGTVLGVLLGMLVADITAGNTVAQLLAFVVCGFTMVALSKVNYVLSTLFITTFLLLSEQFLLAGVITNGWERLVATLMGVGVAFLLIAVMRVLSRGGNPTVTEDSTRHHDAGIPPDHSQ